MEAHGSGRGRELRDAEVGEVAGDLVRGMVAGAVGVWVMDRVDWFMYRWVDAEARRRTEGVRPDGKDPAHVMAAMAAEAAEVELSSPRQNPAGLAVHYGHGVFPGALYGALRGRVRRVGAGGLLFGFGLFLIEDELGPVRG